jgi:hypothetical protein
MVYGTRASRCANCGRAFLTSACVVGLLDFYSGKCEKKYNERQRIHG